MKKLLAIVVLGLLWSGSAYAEVIKYNCKSKDDSTRFDSYTRILDIDKKIVNDVYTWGIAFYEDNKKYIGARSVDQNWPVELVDENKVIYVQTNEMYWDFMFNNVSKNYNKNDPKRLKKLIKRYGQPHEPKLTYTWIYSKDNSITKFYDHKNKVEKSSPNICQRINVIAEKPKEKIKPKTKKPEKQIVSSTNIDPSLITIGSGSGFYINNKGYALTNNHVIDICAQSVAVIDGKETLFRVIATDKTNDVAVLKTNYKSRNFIKINEDGAKLGENVIAVGYPLAGRLSDSVKITKGIVSSLSGLDNNIGQIQIDAALQPGNSGGPVLNENGELVGIASAGLNKLLMAKEAKYIPENVNFAVASPIIVNILKSKKVKYTTPSMFSGSYSNTELAELGDSSTIQLFCRNTRTAYNRLKSSNKYSTVLLDLD